MNDVEPGIHQHFKGGLYGVIGVIGVARHSETDEITVIYEPLYPTDPPRFRSRPIEMFTDTVERDGYSGPRFRPFQPKPIVIHDAAADQEALDAG